MATVRLTQDLDLLDLLLDLKVSIDCQKTKGRKLCVEHGDKKPCAHCRVLVRSWYISLLPSANLRRTEMNKRIRKKKETTKGLTKSCYGKDGRRTYHIYRHGYCCRCGCEPFGV